MHLHAALIWSSVSESPRSLFITPQKTTVTESLASIELFFAPLTGDTYHAENDYRLAHIWVTGKDLPIPVPVPLQLWGPVVRDVTSQHDLTALWQMAEAILYGLKIGRAI